MESKIISVKILRQFSVISGVPSKFGCFRNHLCSTNKNYESLSNKNLRYGSSFIQRRKKMQDSNHISYSTLTPYCNQNLMCTIFKDEILDILPPLSTRMAKILLVRTNVEKALLKITKSFLPNLQLHSPTSMLHDTICSSVLNFKFCNDATFRHLLDYLTNTEKVLNSHTVYMNNTPKDPGDTEGNKDGIDSENLNDSKPEPDPQKDSNKTKTDSGNESAGTSSTSSSKPSTSSGPPTENSASEQLPNFPQDIVWDPLPDDVELGFEEEISESNREVDERWYPHLKPPTPQTKRLQYFPKIYYEEVTTYEPSEAAPSQHDGQFRIYQDPEEASRHWSQVSLNTLPSPIPFQGPPQINRSHMPETPPGRVVRVRRRVEYMPDDSFQPLTSTPIPGNANPPFTSTPIPGDGIPPFTSTPIPGDGIPPFTSTPIPGDGIPPFTSTPIRGDGNPPFTSTPIRDHSNQPLTSTPNFPPSTSAEIKRNLFSGFPDIGSPIIDREASLVRNNERPHVSTPRTGPRSSRFTFSPEPIVSSGRKAGTPLVDSDEENGGPSGRPRASTPRNAPRSSRFMFSPEAIAPSGRKPGTPLVDSDEESGGPSCRPTGFIHSGKRKFEKGDGHSCTPPFSFSKPVTGTQRRLGETFSISDKEGNFPTSAEPAAELQRKLGETFVITDDGNEQDPRQVTHIRESVTTCDECNCVEEVRETRVEKRLFPNDGSLPVGQPIIKTQITKSVPVPDDNDDPSGSNPSSSDPSGQKKKTSIIKPLPQNLNADLISTLNENTTSLCPSLVSDNLILYQFEMRANGDKTVVELDKARVTGVLIRCFPLCHIRIKEKLLSCTFANYKATYPLRVGFLDL